MLFTFLIGLLTVVLVLDCLFLLLLILVQLPKKEAGLGQAFGSSATDALFGAGSGSMLTKMTKYTAVIFFVITFLLAILNAQQSRERNRGRLREAIAKASKAAPIQPAVPAPTTAAGSNTPIKLTLPEAAVKPSNPPVAPTNAVPQVPPSNATPVIKTNTTPVAAPGTNTPAAAAPAPKPVAPTAGTNPPAPQSK